jgi:hypothetical protein
MGMGLGTAREKNEFNGIGPGHRHVIGTGKGGRKPLLGVQGAGCKLRLRKSTLPSGVRGVVCGTLAAGARRSRGVCGLVLVLCDRRRSAGDHSCWPAAIWGLGLGRRPVRQSGRQSQGSQLQSGGRVGRKLALAAHLVASVDREGRLAKRDGCIGTVTVFSLAAHPGPQPLANLTESPPLKQSWQNYHSLQLQAPDQLHHCQ